MLVPRQADLLTRLCAMELGRNEEEKRANKAPEPTTRAVTSRAPSSTSRASLVVAHLER